MATSVASCPLLHSEMDEASAIQLVSQFLHEHGFMSSLKALEADR